MERIAFIGAGNLADSLVGGLLKSGYSSESLSAYDIDSERLRQFCTQHKGIQLCAGIDDVVKHSAVIILCVKPDVVRRVCESLKAALPDGALVISVAAGISLAVLDKWLGRPNLALLRGMPNLPVAVGLGMSVLCANSQVSQPQKVSGESVFRAVGDVSWVADEEWMDAVTALSGSGPAYFFYILQALEQAATRQGLDAALAKQLAIQTMLGAAAFAKVSDVTLEELCRKVASKGGTTEAALAVLKQSRLDEVLQDALDAAASRSREISKETKEQ